MASMLVFVLSLCAAMAIGVPIAFALLFSGVALMLQLDNFNTQILAQNLIAGADNYAMMAVPFFMLAGDLMNEGGLTKRIIKFSLVLIGHIRGGLGYVAVLAMVIFSGLSGSAVATAAAMGSILIPMMVQTGYNRDRSTALVAAGSLMDPIIPPSVPFIFFGVTAGVSISKLFVSGIVPGLIIAVGLAVTWAVVSRKDNAQVLPRASFQDIVKTTVEAIWALFLPVIIIVGMRGGIFTPTEAGVIAVAYALFVGFCIYRELNFKRLFHALVTSAKSTSVIMFLAAASMVSAWLMAIGNIPETVTGILQPFVGNKIILMLVINFIVMLVGTAMDVNPTILILTPVLMPVVKQAGIDPVYFGLVFVLNNVLGLLTPPVGTVLNIACGVGKITMERIIKAVIPFFLVETLILLAFILFPQIVIAPLHWFTK